MYPKLSDAEKAERVEVLTEMFLGFGLRVNDTRLRWYGNLTSWIPQELYRQAVTLACATKGERFPPTPKQIIDSGLSLCPRRYSPHTGMQPVAAWSYRARQALLADVSGP